MYNIVEKNGNTYFVNSQGSMAIVHGNFYINGRKAEEGLYTINITDGSQVLVTVGIGGQVLDKVVIAPTQIEEVTEEANV